MTRLLLVLALLASSSASARRFAVLIGNNDGGGNDVALHFAEDDAERLAQTLTAVGGFDAHDVVVVRGGDSSDVRRAVIDTNTRIRELTEPAVLFVFYSGHADSTSLHLGDERLPLAELEGLTRGSPASFRVLVLDACRSGSLTQVKGSTPGPDFALPSSSSGDDVVGFVTLTAAAAGEDAAEADSLGASFFTHALTTGLLGAADDNHDDRVTLNEVYEYAFHRTVQESANALSGTQHPTFRYEMRGKGELVLSELGGALHRGIAVFPAEVAFIVVDDRGRVVAELPASGPRRLSLAVGSYRLQGRARRARYDGLLEIEDQQQTTVDLATLQRSEYARLVRKGDAAAPVSLALTTFGLVRSGTTQADAPCFGARVQVPIETAVLSLTPRLDACRSSWTDRIVAVDEAQLELSLDVHRYLDTSVGTFGVGAVLGGVYTRQDFSTRGTAPARQALSPSFGVVLDAVVDLGGPFFAVAALDARSMFVWRVGKAGSATIAETPLTVGGALGVGLRLF